jgi:hypothetical protein
MYEPGGIGSVRHSMILTGTSMYYSNVIPGERGATGAQHLPHVKNFGACVKSREKARGRHRRRASGHDDLPSCERGLQNRRTKAVWDAGGERFTNSPESNALLTRVYRAPWHLPGMDA